MLGSGSIIVADDSVSIPRMALRTAHFYRHESRGSYAPPRGHQLDREKMLERVQLPARPPRWTSTSSNRSSTTSWAIVVCVLGDAMAMPVSRWSTSSATNSRRRSYRSRASLGRFPDSSASPGRDVPSGDEPNFGGESREDPAGAVGWPRDSGRERSLMPARRRI